MMSPEYTKRLQELAHGKRDVAGKEPIPDVNLPAGDDLRKVPDVADGQLLGQGGDQVLGQGQDIAQQIIQMQKQQLDQERQQQQLPGQEVKDAVIQQRPASAGDGQQQGPQGGIGAGGQQGLQAGQVPQQVHGAQLGTGQQVVRQGPQPNLGAGGQPGFPAGQVPQQGQGAQLGTGQQVVQQGLQPNLGAAGQPGFQAGQVLQQGNQGQFAAGQQIVGQQQYQGQAVGQPGFQGQVDGQGQQYVQGQGLGQVPLGQGGGAQPGQGFGQGQFQGFGLNNQQVQGGQNGFHGVPQNRDARDTGLNLNPGGVPVKEQNNAPVGQRNVINTKQGVLPDGVPLQGQAGGIPQADREDKLHVASLKKAGDAFDEMFGFDNPKEDVMDGMQPRQMGGIRQDIDIIKNDEVPVAQVLQQDVGNAMLQEKVQVGRRSPGEAMKQGGDGIGQPQIDNGGIQGVADQDDNDPEEGGGMGMGEDPENKIDDEVKLGKPLGEREQLEETRNKYKQIADQFEARREVQLGRGQNLVQDQAGVQNNGFVADQGLNELNKPGEKHNDLSEILKARAKLKEQQNDPGHVYQSIDEQGAHEAGKQLVFDAKPLGGIGQNLQPAANAKQPLGNQDNMDHIFKKADNLEQLLAKQDDNGQAVLGRPPVQGQNGIQNQFKEKPVGMQGNQGENANQGAEDMDDHRVGNLLKEQNNMPFQPPADVNFDDVNGNNRDNAAENENMAGVFQGQNRGFRKLLTHETVPQQGLGNKESDIEPPKDVSNILRSDETAPQQGLDSKDSETEAPKDVSNILRSDVSQIGEKKQVQMRISLGSYDHEIMKKHKSLDTDVGFARKAEHERKKWSGSSPTVPRSNGTVMGEEEAMKQKEDQDKKSSFLPWERTDSFNNLTQVLKPECNFGK